MELGFISFLGLAFVCLMILPNIFYAIKNKDKKNKYKNTCIYAAEFIGRFFSMAFMIFPLGIGEFGFSRVYLFCIYLLCNIVMVTLYIIIFIKYFKKETLKRALFLSILPTLVFLISGITLRYIPLIVSSIIYGTAHTKISYENKK